MGKYTISIRNICSIYGRENVENWFKDYNLSDYLTEEQINSINSYGLWNKEKLAKKIIDYYFMREIAFETPALFKHFAKIEMNNIMEEYLPIIYSNSIKFDPLVNVDFTETFEREIEGKNENEGKSQSESSSNSNATSSSISNSSGLNVSSDTPQGQINKTSILNGAYASTTNATENEIENETTNETENSINDKTITSNNASSNTKEIYTKKQKGNSGISTTAQALILQYRDTIRAVDKEIISKLNTLFYALF